jgi:hypothetical protein
MIPGMFRISMRFTSTLALVCAFAVSAAAQGPIAIQEDLRIFTVVAALNVAGFDVELGSEYHPIRAEIRKIADTLDPVLLKKMRDFYSSHKGGRSDEEQLAKYISLAVVLTDPPELKPSAREEALPDDARQVLEFAELVREFYQKAGIIRQWARFEAAYGGEMDRWGPPIRDALAKTDAYMRGSSGGFRGQTMRIVVELAAPRNSVNVRSHEGHYSVVLGYATTPTLKADDVRHVRHAYLHLRLDNAALAASIKVSNRSGLTMLITQEDGVSREYATDFDTMLVESLIRALELRMDRAPAAVSEEAIRGHYRTGLLLTPYFFSALGDYELKDTALSDEVENLVKGIDIGKEQARFRETFRSIPLPERTTLLAEVPVAPKANPMMELLLAGEAAFANDKPRARAIFETVLRDFDPNSASALYGIALIEMDNGRVDEASLDKALQYFGRTIESKSATKEMQTWSHIHIGHILDFKCQRQAAIDNYKKALEIGDNSKNARGTAERDLAKPFGGECRP